MSQPKCLAPDGAYSYDHSINGYCALAQQYKEQFLRDARTLLKQVGQHLSEFGWTECDIRVNPSGVAGSGDVHADFWNPADPFNTVYCTIGASAISFGARKDGIMIMARKEKRVEGEGRRTSKPYYRNVWMGINQWIDPGMNSQDLASRLYEIGRSPEAEQARMLPGTVYHSSTAGALHIPSAVVRNHAEAEALKEAVVGVIHAAQADVGVHAGEQTVAEAKGLHQMSLFEAFEMQGV